ncbi:MULTISPECIES: alpha/beta hydrolase fold domain-containing protein [Burkholderia]|uniref:alpha/beta hydrolase fold domain-containing protein n=1 Tax=Burkholderia TaxID=32008 RepID=UPI00016AE097|nr:MULTISPECIES: alpha/beta hydrolase fold domain-containing protein [Burkholderia]
MVTSSWKRRPTPLSGICCPSWNGAAEHAPIDANIATLLGLDPARIDVGGDSAGGNLAAAACLVAREQGGPPIAHQLLLYPLLDASMNTESYRTYGQGYYLAQEVMRYCFDMYLADQAEGGSPCVSPLRAASREGLPPVTLPACEYDPVRDEAPSVCAAIAASRRAGRSRRAARDGPCLHSYVRRAPVAARRRPKAAARSARHRSEIVMESCINIQYSTRRNRAAPVPAQQCVRRACEPPAAFRRRELWLTHSDGQTNCHPAI